MVFMLGISLYKLMIWAYYLLIPTSMITTVVFDRKYEKYKRDKGYKNNYKGTYMTKGFFDGYKFKTFADLVVTFLVPGYQYEPIIELVLFKGEAKSRLHKEEDSKAIEWVDPNIIDGDFKLISEEREDKEENLSGGEEQKFSMEALTMHAAYHMENPDFYGEGTEEYEEAVEAYCELYEHYMGEINKQNAEGLGETDSKREPHLK